MLDTQELANYLNGKLSAYDEKYQFNLVAEVGKAEQGKINGVIKGSGMPSNIANYVEVEYNYSIEIVSPSAMANNTVMRILEIIGEMIRDNNDAEVKFAKGVATLTYSLGKAERYQTVSNSGNNVPIRFEVKALYTEGSLTSTNKKWFLNDMEIPYTSEDVFLTKEGSTRKINAENYTKTLLTGQTKQYKFVFPYQANDLCDMLQEDILRGDFKKQYTLKYVDGRKFTFTNPFETTVSIFANGNTGSKRAKVSMFDITFVDADNGADRTKYYLALIDNPFDNQTEDTRWFNSQSEQREYFENKVLIGADYEQIKAPNLNSLDLTSQVYENTKNYEMLDLVNKNYAIIKVVRGTEEDLDYKVDYFYYFVQSCQIGANGLMLYDLKLDSIQTYLFNPDLEFSDCFIEKSHLNRWVENEDGTVSFDGTVNSKLFEREDIQNMSKRLVRRSYIDMYPDTPVGNWLKENVLGFVYIYLSPNHPYYAYDVQTGSKIKESSSIDGLRLQSMRYNTNNGVLPSNMSVVVYPVLKRGTYIQLEKDASSTGSLYSDCFWGNNNLLTFDYPHKTIMDYIADNNNGYTNVYAVKFSPYNIIKNITGVITQSGRGLVVQAGLLNGTLHNPMMDNTYTAEHEYYETVAFGKTGSLQCGVVLSVIENEYSTQEYVIDKQFTFAKNEIINANKNVKFNPKLLSSDYFEVTLSDSTENGFVYDLQKLNNNKLKVLITDSKAPDSSKLYMRFEANGLYVKETENNLTGFIGNNVDTFIMPTTAYQNMLAQNKNFFLQNSVNRAVDLASSGMNIAGNLASGNTTGAISSTIGTGLNYARSIVNQQLTIDNLRNAPDSIIGARGNIHFASMYSKNGVVVEEYDILPNEKNIVNDMMVKYGFTTNLIGNLRDYLNSSVENGRKYFNYIKAQIQNIYGIPLSNIARADIRDRFMNGIRFWNSDTIDYSKENYEKWLEN